jgi:hypothetical protein
MRRAIMPPRARFAVPVHVKYEVRIPIGRRSLEATQLIWRVTSRRRDRGSVSHVVRVRRFRPVARRGRKQCCGGEMIKWLKRIFCLVHRWDWTTDTCIRCGKRYDYRD